jgi:hypothetical protein
MTYEDWRNFPSNETRWCFHIVIRQEMKIVLDILDTQSNSNPYTEGTVIVDIKRRELLSNNTLWLGEQIQFGGIRCRNKVHGNRRPFQIRRWNPALRQTNAKQRKDANQFHRF